MTEIDPKRLQALELKEEILILQQGIFVARAKIKQNLLQLEKMGEGIPKEVLPPDDGNGAPNTNPKAR